jgi:hypothetical protein
MGLRPPDLVETRGGPHDVNDPDDGHDPDDVNHVDNELLDFLQAELLARGHGEAASFEPSWRPHLARAYSWAIPNRAALCAIAEEAGPAGVMEVGAGTGYWSALLRRQGVDVVATDAAPPRPDLGQEYNLWHPGATTFVEVRQQDAQAAASEAGARALLMCWPPSISEMGFDAVSAYRGPVVVYVGEWSAGSTGTPRLHQLLESEWDLVRVVDIPTWWGREDKVRVFRRRSNL